MKRRGMLPVLASLLALAICGCSGLQQKIEAGRQFAKVMQPGHRYQAFFMPSAAMEPTVRLKDTMLVDKSAYDSARPQRGDIIVFMPPLASKAPFIKRVVALPGDALSIRKGTILVNGRPLPRPFPVLHPNYEVAVSSYRITVDGEPLDPAIADVAPRSRWTAPDRLPPGCYFVVGDNVDNSEDSHVWGCAELRGTFSTGVRKGEPADLIGKVVHVFPGGSAKP
jgi:signal peptidase I